MKKELIVFSLVLLLSISLVSAGWFEDIFWGERNVQMSPSSSIQSDSGLSSKTINCMDKCFEDKCSRISLFLFSWQGLKKWLGAFSWCEQVER